MSKTHAEIRNESHERELFIITQEMKEAMEKAKKKQITEIPENRKIYKIDKDVNEYFTDKVKEKRVQRLSKKLKKLETYKKRLEEIGDKKKE